MYTKPHFTVSEISDVIAFVKKKSFGVLATHLGGVIYTSPVPFDLRVDENKQLFIAGHIARANEMASAFSDNNAATITVVGSESYVPAEWFGVRSRIPTWVYCAVELSGSLTPVSYETMVSDVEDMIGRLQQQAVPGSTWTLREINTELSSQYLKHIVGYRINNLNITSCYRLNQGKGESKELAENLMGSSPDLAALVLNPPTIKAG